MVLSASKARPEHRTDLGCRYSSIVEHVLSTQASGPGLSLQQSNMAAVLVMLVAVAVAMAVVLVVVLVAVVLVIELSFLIDFPAYSNPSLYFPVGSWCKERVHSGGNTVCSKCPES